MEYMITQRQRTTFIGPTGHAVDGYRVYYRMDDGTADYVEIEKSQYNGESVKVAIEADIETHRGVVSS